MSWPGCPISDVLAKTSEVDHEAVQNRLYVLPQLAHTLCPKIQKNTHFIRIGPDRAYPLHFTHPQLLLLPLLLLPMFSLVPLSQYKNFCEE